MPCKIAGEAQRLLELLRVREFPRLAYRVEERRGDVLEIDGVGG